MATMTVEIDKAGRIVVPKKLRDALHLAPGTKLRVKRHGDSLVLDPDLPLAKLIIEDGMPLIIPADPLTAPVLTVAMVNESIQQAYLERERRILGLDEDGEESRQDAIA